MADIPRSSFIPKQTAGSVPVQARRRRLNVFGILSSILIFASLIMAGVAFGMRELALRELEAQRQELEAQYANFDDSKVAKVRQMDQRIRAARHLLNNHLSLTKIFDAFELDTLVDVQFTSFDYSKESDEKDSESSSGAEVTLAGVTDEFATIWLQSEQFGGNVVLSDARVNSIAVESGGEDDATAGITSITFDVSSNIPSGEIIYNPVAETQLLRNQAILDEATTSEDSTNDVSTEDTGSDVVQSNNTSQ